MSLAALVVGAVIAGTLTLPSAASAAVSPTAPVVINEVYGGGGNSGAPVNRDFVEIYNPGAAAVDLTGWSVQYASAAGTTFQMTPLQGSIAAGGYLLVGEGSGTNGAALTVDISGTIPMSASSGVIALTNTAMALAGCGTTCAQAATVVDFVGYGATANVAGSGAAPGLSNTTSASRNSAHANTANNSADFTAGAPSPTAAGTVVDPGPGTEPVSVSIADIQGTGTASPYAGQNVTTTGVVTASYPTGGFAGYVIQTAGSGGNLDLRTHTASDAVFVYARNATTEVALGQTVSVTGAVSEFSGLTEITVAPGAAKVLPDAPAPVAASVSWPTTDAQRESLESMLIAPKGDFTVTNTYSTNQYGEVGLASGTTPLHQPTDVARPGSPEAAAVIADNAARAVSLDDGQSTNFLSAANTALTPAYVSLTEPIVVGASVSFSAPLIVDWRNNTWKLNPTTPLVGDGTGHDQVAFANTRTAAPASVGGDISVASFNVLNYFTTLGEQNPACVAYNDRTGNGLTVRDGCELRGAWDAADLERQQAKIVTAINDLDASVVGLMEIENSARLGEPADEATATLVAALNAAAGTTKWAFVPSSTELPAAALQDVITSAIIYQPALVSRVGASRALGTQSGADQAFGNAREPIAQVFAPANGGKQFLFVVNHFKSKGSAGPWPGDADTGDGQGSSNESRVRQATALRDWVASIQGSVSSVALAGDFNSYGQEDPLQVLYQAGYVDAEQALGTAKSSYSFGGLSGSLDHVLLNQAALGRATGTDIWNINSGESVALEYSRYNTVGTLFYAPDEYRSSDHDPVKVGLARGVDDRAATSTSLFALPGFQLNGFLSATLVATVRGAGASGGVVEFREGSTVIGTVPVTRSTATLRLPSRIARGVHTYAATFVPTDPTAVIGSSSSSVKVIALF
ncbi:MAG: ExeM/NucH family extracellular endonuclease [Actinobacteria bacterium]|nr:ExeM/NucH family extracellular endonuclease [Actinomycetota bacterium]